MTSDQATMPRKQKRDDLSVKLTAEAVRMAKLVAYFKGQTIAEYLSNMVLPLVKKDYEKVKKQISDNDLPK